MKQLLPLQLVLPKMKVREECSNAVQLIFLRSHAAERFPGYDFQPCIILVILLNVIPLFQTVGKIELEKNNFHLPLQEQPSCHF